MARKTFKAAVVTGMTLAALAGQATGAKAIVGGEPATSSDAPFTALITLERPTGSSVCAGTFVNTTTVLLPAHCIKPDTGGTYDTATVQYGSTVRNGPDSHSIVVPKSSFVVHPEFNPVTLNNDIALLRLGAAVDIQAANLPTSAARDSMPLTMTGWGAPSQNLDILSIIQLKANFNRIPGSQCLDHFGLDNLPVGSMCIEAPEASPCDGDSGDPMANDGAVYGFPTIGDQSCKPGAPAIATNVFHYLDWIKANA
ncbi:serine protease [Kitasatospora sp. NPDC096077]|uniref:S1 family peptidase n=1 Tax=Kitasatospora sp. NPDC096077 TaxID=3155544 RepID=UPI0033332AC8